MFKKDHGQGGDNGNGGGKNDDGKDRDNDHGGGKDDDWWDHGGGGKNDDWWDHDKDHDHDWWEHDDDCWGNDDGHTDSKKIWEKYYKW
jgi:hypothetical protein